MLEKEIGTLYGEKKQGYFGKCARRAKNFLELKKFYNW